MNSSFGNAPPFHYLSRKSASQFLCSPANRNKRQSKALCGQILKTNQIKLFTEYVSNEEQIYVKDEARTTNVAKVIM